MGIFASVTMQALFPINFWVGPGDEAMSTLPSGLARATSIFLSMILLAASELSKLPKCVSGEGGQESQYSSGINFTECKPYQQQRRSQSQLLIHLRAG